MKTVSPAVPSCAVKTIAKSVLLWFGVAVVEIVVEELETVLDASIYSAADGAGPAKKLCGDWFAKENANKPVGLSVCVVGVKIFGICKVTSGEPEVVFVLLFTI